MKRLKKNLIFGLIIFSFLKKAFKNIINQIDVVLSAGTSACIEAIFNGIPVVIISKKGMDIYNPIPEVVNQQIWDVCHNSSELSKSLIKFMEILNSENGTNYFKDIGENIRCQYLEAPTVNNIKDFLELS